MRANIRGGGVLTYRREEEENLGGAADYILTGACASIAG
jgi:hypothetical protein